MDSFNYNVGLVSKFAIDNFWSKLDKSLPAKEQKRLYEEFFKENSSMITESVDSLLKDENIVPINEGFFDDAKTDEDDDDESFIPDGKGKIRTMDDFEKSQHNPKTKTISKSLTDDQAQYTSHSEIFVKNAKEGTDPYLDGDNRDINVASDVVYHMLEIGKIPGMSTQDKILPYTMFNTADVSSFAAVFAFKDLPNVDLSTWNVSNGEDFEGMFYKSTFNNDSIIDWRLSKVNNVTNMFVGSDFDKVNVIKHWKNNGYNPYFNEYPSVGQMSSDSSSEMQNKMIAQLGNSGDDIEDVASSINDKVKKLKGYNNQSIMDTDEKKNYVMKSADFIKENYGVNEGVIGNFAKNTFGKIKTAVQSFGIKLKNGFMLALDKTLDFGANLPQNIVAFIKSGGVKGVYAETGRRVRYPEKPGYYDKIEEGSKEYANYVKFLEFVSNSGSVSESVVNERRVGLKSHEIDTDTNTMTTNIDAVDVSTAQLERDVIDNINEIIKSGKPTGKPMLVWGAPGIGKTSIPNALINAANSQIAKGGGDSSEMLSIIVVDCSTLQAGDLFMPMPVKITESDIDTVRNHPVFKKLLKSGEIKESDLPKYISQHSSDAPKTWLPMYEKSGDPKVDRLRDIKANGGVGMVYDADGNEIGEESVGGGGILMFDEFLRADPDTLFGIAQIMMNRKTTSGYTLGSKWYCMACSNRPVDDVQVNTNWQSLSDALKQRFVSVNFVPTFKEWAKWAKEKGGFDDFTIEYIGAFGDDNPRSRWHNIDPTESTSQNLTRQLSPRQWSFCIEELNRVCRIRGYKSYTELGEDEFLRIVSKFLPDKAAKEYVEDYMENNGGGAFKYPYADIINNPAIKVEKGTKSSVVTNHLKREIMRMYDVSNPIPPEELEKVVQFLENNFDGKSGNTTSDFIARVFKYCDLTGVNYDEGSEKSKQWLSIWKNYQKNHPDIDMQGLYKTIPNKMI